MASQNSRCRDVFVHYVMINGIRSLEGGRECSSGEHQKQKYYSIATNSHLVILSFTVVGSSSLYRTYLPDFEKTISSLLVKDQIDVKSALKRINNQKNMDQNVPFDSKTVEVKIESSSTIKNFNINRGGKQISFDVDGNSKMRGITEISIGHVLKGPFKVKLDGKTKSFTIIKDRTTGETLISLSYNHETRHAISIFGGKISTG